MNPKQPQQAFLLAGGPGGDNRVVLRVISEKLRELPHAKAAYIGTANGDRYPFFLIMRTLLHQAGAETVDLVPLAKERIDRQKAISTLYAADIIFLSGGEVEDGMKWLHRHDLTSTLVSLYGEGKLFIGVSAGAIMLGSHWVRWDDPDDQSTANLFPCLDIVPTVFDTHAEDEDWIELKTVLRLQGEGSEGIGLPRGCIVKGDSQGNLEKVNGNHLIFRYEQGSFTIHQHEGV